MGINTQRLHNQLILHEGLRLVAYDDATGMPPPPDGHVRGNLTVGVGHNLDAKPLTDAQKRFIGHDGRKLVITQAQAMMILDDDIRDVVTDLDIKMPWWRHLDEVRQRVLVDMCFNLGIHGLMLFKRFLANLRTGLWKEASNEMVDSLWAHQVGKRADRLADMVETGKDYTV